MGELNWAMPAIDTVFWAQLGQIMLINIILSGDNAVVIALAVNKLSPQQKKWGIILGSGLAVVLRILLTGVAVFLLTIPFLKIVGGVLILWIAVKLFAEGHEENVEAAGSLKAAVWTILIADLVMSIDNVLAVAGAANGGMVLIIIGLVTSIPIVIFGSTLLSALMQKFPIIITIGAAILGKVGGEMIITDAWVHKTFHPDAYIINLFNRDIPYIDWGIQILCAIGVIIVGKLIMKKSGDHKEEGSEG